MFQTDLALLYLFYYCQYVQCCVLEMMEYPNANQPKIWTNTRFFYLFIFISRGFIFR